MPEFIDHSEVLTERVEELENWCSLLEQADDRLEAQVVDNENLRKTDHVYLLMQVQHALQREEANKKEIEEIRKQLEEQRSAVSWLLESMRKIMDKLLYFNEHFHEARALILYYIDGFKVAWLDWYGTSYPEFVAAL
jgi:uncharacterized coiled-coil protein SlyX